MLRIDRGGDRRLHAILARFFSAPVRSVVENATPVEIRKEHGFPQVFGKASQKTLGFPTFSTTPTARTITDQPNLRQWEYSLDWPIFCLKNGETLLSPLD